MCLYSRSLLPHTFLSIIFFWVICTYRVDAAVFYIYTLRLPFSVLRKPTIFHFITIFLKTENILCMNNKKQIKWLRFFCWLEIFAPVMSFEDASLPWTTWMKKLKFSKPSQVNNQLNLRLRTISPERKYFRLTF